MGKNLIEQKSLDFAVRIVNLRKTLIKNGKEVVISLQLLRSGTSVGANIREAEQAESKSDFIHKMAIAQKEINETLFWLELLFKTDYLSKDEFESMNTDAEELLRVLTAILRTAKKNERGAYLQHSGI